MSTTHPATLPERPMRADVYRNLNDDCLSVLDRRPDSDEYGRVVAHTDAVYLMDAEVVTYDGKRQQARESGQKNVHAMFRGDCVAYSAMTPENVLSETVRVEYHMDREGCFYTPDDERILGADLVIVDLDSGIHVRNPELE